MLIVQEAEQQTRKIERDLFLTLEKIYKYRIRRDPDYPLYSSSIHSKYYNLVFAAIRKAIELIHKEGIEYVGQKLKQEIFMTNTDIDTIKVQAEFTTDLFFKALARQSEMVISESSNALKGAAESNNNEAQPAAPTKEEEEVEPIDVQTGFLAIVKRIIISAATIALSKSILSKTNQLPKGLSDTANSIYSYRVRWVCQFAERTCMVCAQLHGRIFFANDPAIPLPGTLGTLGTHPNCKCYLELVR